MIYKMSRFSRSGGSAIGLVNDLVKNQGVHLIEVSTELDTTTEEGEIQIHYSLINARKENMERLTYTLPGLKHFIKSGNWLGRAPRGYDHYGPKVKDPKFVQGCQELKINDDGKLLKMAWDWKLQNIQDFQIRQKLSIRGLRINKQTLSAMWRNPFYCGINKNTFLEGEVVEGNWKELVSKDSFKIINDRFDAKPKKEYKPYTAQIDRPLQNQLYCGCCGSKMTGYKAKGKYDYYKCLNTSCKTKDLSANSSKKSIKEGIHNLFQNLLTNFKLKEVLEDVFKEQMKLTINGQSSKVYNDQTILKKRLKDLKSKKETLDSRFAFGEIDNELYNRFIGAVTSELIEIEEKLEDSQIKISNLDKKVSELIEFSKNLSNIWVSGEYETKLSVQKLLFPEGIVIDPEDRTYRTSNLNPIFGLIHSFTGDNDSGNKKRTGRNTDPSCVVAGTGLEPVTFGL
jgi:site-specific DNA recombinase